MATPRTRSRVTSATLRVGSSFRILETIEIETPVIEQKEEITDTKVEETQIEEVVEEVLQVKLSERATRLIDGDNEDSMEKKKTEGYF